MWSLTALSLAAPPDTHERIAWGAVEAGVSSVAGLGVVGSLRVPHLSVELGVGAVPGGWSARLGKSFHVYQKWNGYGVHAGLGRGLASTTCSGDSSASGGSGATACSTNYEWFAEAGYRFLFRTTPPYVAATVGVGKWLELSDVMVPPVAATLTAGVQF